MMFKKIQNSLLTKQPLIWNTKLLPAVIVLLCINLIFFFMGVLGFQSVRQLHNYSIFYRVESFILPSLLVGFLFLIIWLFYYTKNNAFKNIYPIGKWYLIKEFFIIVLIVFLNCTYMVSYRYGYAWNAHSKVKHVNVVDKVNKANLASFFLPSSIGSYEIARSCDSQYFESTEPYVEPPYLERMKMRNYRYEDSSWNQLVDRIIDSLAAAKAIKEKDLVEINYTRFYPNYKSPEEVEDPYEEDYRKEEEKRPMEYSYFYYCDHAFDLPSDCLLKEKFIGKQALAARGQNLIKNKNKPEISSHITSYLQDLDEAKVFHYIDKELFANQALGDSLLTENNFDYTEDFHPDRYKDWTFEEKEALVIRWRRNNDYKYNSQHINKDDYKEYLSHVATLQNRFHDTVWSIPSWYILYFVAFAIAGLIFLFRLNGIKALLLSFVVAGVISLVVGLGFVLANIHSDIFVLFTLLVLSLVLVFIGFQMVMNKSVKAWAAIALNIGTVALLLFWIFLDAIIVELLAPSWYYFSYAGISRAYEIMYHSGAHDFLTNSVFTVLGIYIFIQLLCIVLYAIPLSKRLKANPYE